MVSKEYKIETKFISADEMIELDNNWEDIVHKYTREIIAAKEQAFAQYIMKKQQDEIDRLRLECQMLKEENKQLRKELAESQECEDPGLRSHKKFSKIVTDIFNDREVKHAMYERMVERERKEGIPLEDERR